MPGEQVGSAYVTLGLDSSKFDSGMGQAEGKLRGFAGSMANILKVGAVAGGAAIAGAATLGIKSFVNYESGLYDIAKVTGMTGDELKGLGEGLRAMSLESGQAVTGLEAIAAIAGQMGMQGSADILKFTETVNQASVAFGIAPEAAAAAMGKIGNIWDIPTQELYKMGSAVNYLGNTTNASEAQLLDYMMAIGNQPRVLGMTSQETLLFGSTLVSMGMDASDAGTRLNAAFGQQGLIGHLPAAAKQLGVTEAALKGMIDADPTDTVLRLIDSMSGITSETERLQVAQEIFGAIGGKAIVPLIGRTDQFRASLGNVNTEYEKGTAMAEEYKTRWGALGVQLSRVRQGINDVAITIGEGLAPYVRGFADLLNNDVLPAVNSFIAALMAGDWDTVGQKIGGVAKTIATAFTAALGGAALVAGIATLAPVLLTAFAGLAAAVSGQVGAIAAGIGGRFALMKGAAIGHILALKTAAVGHFVTMKTQALTQIGAMVTGTVTRYGQMAAGAIASLVTMTATVVGNFAMQKAIALSHLVAMVPLVGAKYAMMAQASIYNFGIMVTTQAVAWGQMVAGAVTNLATMVGRTAIGFASMAASALGSAARMAAGVVGSFATMAAGALAQVARMVAGIAISVVGMAAGLVASIAGPVALIIAGIAGIGLALIADWDAVGSALAGAFSHAKEVVTEVYDMIKAGDYSRAISKIGDEFKRAAKWAYDSIRNIDWKRALSRGYEAVKSFGQNLLSILKGIDWRGALAGVSSALMGIDFKSVLNEVSTALGSIGSQLYGAIKGIDWNDVKAGAVAAFEAIKEKAYDIGGWISEAISNIDWETLKADAAAAWEFIKSSAATIFEGITTVITDVGRSALKILSNVDWKSVGAAVRKGISDGWSALESLGKQLLGWLKGVDWPAVGQTVREGVSAGWSALESLGRDLLKWLKEQDWDSAGKALEDGVRTGVNALYDIGSEVLDYLKGKLSEAVTDGTFSSIGSSIGGAIKGGLVSAFTGKDGGGPLANAVDWAALGLQAAGDFAGGFVDAMFGSLADKLGLAILQATKVALQALNLGGIMDDSIRGIDKAIELGEKGLKKREEGTWQPGKKYYSWGGTTPTSTYGPAGSPNWPGTSRGQKYGDWVWTGTEWINSASYNPKTPEEAPREMTAKEVSTAIARAADTAPTSGPTLSIDEFRKAWLQLNPSGKSNQLFTEAPVAPQGAIRGTATRSGDKFVVTDSSGARSVTSSINDAVMMMARAGMAIEDIARTTGISKDNWEQLGLWKSYQSGDATWRAKSGDAADAAKRSYDLEKKKYDNTMDTYRKYQQYVAEGKILWDAQTGTWKWADKTIQDAVEKVERTSAAVTKSEKEAAEETKIKLIGAADYAARSLALGAEIGKKFTTDAGQSVVVSFDKATNKFAANIGLAGSNLKDGGDYNLQRAKEMGAVIVDSGATSGRRQTDAATIAGSKTTTAASQAASSINSGADQARTKIAAAGDVGTKLIIGAQYAANAIVSAGSSFASAVRGAITAFMSNASYYRNPFQTPQYKPSGFAIGTKTTGPELAMIGEDGPSWPEFIIPTKTKRWDLLTAALRAYGVRGFAEGGSTGGASGGDASVGFSGSIIISIGKLNQAVVRALADIVNRFRTSWAVIKAETTKHWIALTSNTNAELSQYRSVVAQAMSEARTAVLSAWTDLLDRGKILWTEGRESMSQQAAYLADQIKMSADNTRIAVQDLWNATKDELNNGIMELQTVWQTGWQKMDSDLAAASANIKSKVQEIAALLKSISGANVNISVGGFIGGGGGGGGGGGRGGGGGFADAFINNYFSGTTCEIDELSGMSPGLIESLAKSGAWKPNENLASQMIAQAIGYGTSAAAAKSVGATVSAFVGGRTGGLFSAGTSITPSSSGLWSWGGTPKGAPSVGGRTGGLFSAGTSITPSSSGLWSWGGTPKGAPSVGPLKLGRYDAGGISARPQIAVVSGQGEPELHLTKSNVREFLGDGGDRPMIIQVFLGDREVTDLVMKKAVSKMRTKGLQMG